MFTFHKLTKDQYEKVVQENKSISEAIFMITDTNKIYIYNNKKQLEMSDNISTLLTKLPELKDLYDSFKKIKNNTSNNINNEIKQNIIQNEIIQNNEKDFDLNNFIFETKIKQNNNQKQLNSKKEDKIIINKFTPQKEAVKWFKDNSKLINFNEESFSNKLGIQ